MVSSVLRKEAYTLADYFDVAYTLRHDMRDIMGYEAPITMFNRLWDPLYGNSTLYDYNAKQSDDRCESCPNGIREEGDFECSAD